MKPTVIILSFFLVSFVFATNRGILPTPRVTEEIRDTFFLNDYTLIITSSTLSENGCFAVTQFQNCLAEKENLSLNATNDPFYSDDVNTILIGNPDKDKQVAERMEQYGLTISKEVEKEGYVLGIGKEGIVIGAKSDAGILYGTITLKQIIFSQSGDIFSGEVKIPGVKITDWPALEMRGIHDDVARGQVSTVENYKQIIRSMAEYKMNTLMLYMEDLFRFKAYPEIGVGRGAFTKQEVDELEAYAKPYNVQIIPIFQMLGHMANILTKEEFLHLAEYPGSDCLRICDSTYIFLENCVKELADAFDSEFFHAGLDETWDMGRGRSKALVDSIGSPELHAQHYNKVYDILAKYGKRMMFYNRMYERPDVVNQIPKDVVSMYYLYSSKDYLHTLVTKIAESGASLGLHPGVSNWGRFFPSFSKAVANIREMNHEAEVNNALVSTVCTWGDGGGKNLRELAWYGYAWQGETSWSPETTDIETFGDNYFNLRYGEGTSQKFKEIYSLLEKWEKILNISRTIPPFFSHPFLLNRGSDGFSEERLEMAKNSALEALSILDNLDPKVKYNKSDLDYLEYIAHSYLNFVESVSLVNDLSQTGLKNLSGNELGETESKFVERIKAHRNELTRLRDTFEKLWLRTNLPANLQYNIDSYNHLIKVWDDVESRIQNGQFAYNPLTPAKWIYHPDGFLKNDTIGITYFRKTIQKPNDLINAHIQLVGDTRVKLFVNGKLVGEQHIRRDFIRHEDAVLRLYDLKPFLKNGENVIAIEAQNYLSATAREPGGPRGCAGFHLYGEIEHGNGSMETILSDSSWKASITEKKGWKEIGFNDDGWPDAMEDKEPALLITYPDFTEGQRGFADK